MPYYGLDIYYFILVVPALILSLYAQVKVKTTFRKYSSVMASRGISAVDAVSRVFSYYGITDVRIERIHGNLTDHFDPRSNVIRLSDGVINSSSIAAIGVACHEAGHAAQHAESYVPIRLRNAILPVCNFGAKFGIPIAILGYFLGFGPLVLLGIMLYTFVFIFQLVTLPVEFNASRRAIKVLDETAVLDSEELKCAEKVLKAAAMTYVASMLTSLASLLRLLLRFSNSRRR